MAGGTAYRGEYQGTELEWGLEEEVNRLRPLFPQIDWPDARLEDIVLAARRVWNAADVNELLGAATP